jgi:hypothetical protein
MKKLLGLAVVALLSASRAGATPIIVSEGDFVLFNFDLTDATPPPPYSSAILHLGRTGLDFFPPDVGEWTFWTELNASGTVFLTAGVNLSGFGRPELNDGVVSATLSMTAGSITVDPCLLGITADGARTECANLPPPPPPPVPEPATLSLLGAGIAAAMFRHRRRTKITQ